MPNNKPNSGKLNGSTELFANILGELIEDAAEKAAERASEKTVTKNHETIVTPLMELINEVRENLKEDIEVLNKNMNETSVVIDQILRQNINYARPLLIIQS